jgi:GlcNAc-P-P-Und epimerase
MSIQADSAVVFGGSGFIGTELVQRLVEDGVRQVVSVDLLPPRRRFAGVEYVVADVREAINLKCEPQIVFNLAAVHRTPGHSDAEYYDTNVAGALRVIEFCESVDVQTLVFTSSISVYGSSDTLTTEASPLRPNSAYGKSKAMAESIHEHWRRDDQRLVIVRPAVTFGHGEGGNFERLHRAIKSHYFLYPGRRDTIKACGYVMELVRCIDWALNQEDEALLFNFSYPKRYTIEDIVRSVARHDNLKEPTVTVPTYAINLIQRLSSVDRTLERTRKLTESTNVYPGVLVDRGYEYATDLDSGIAAWMTIARGGSNSTEVDTRHNDSVRKVGNIP